MEAPHRTHKLSKNGISVRPIPSYKGQEWHTSDEITFLNNLGSRVWSSCSTPRRQLLQCYLEAIPSRLCWGKLDAVQVESACRAMLAEAQPSLTNFGRL